MTPQEKLGGGSKLVVEAGYRNTRKLVDWGLCQGTPASKEWPVETPPPATGLERVPPKKGRVEIYASSSESSELMMEIFKEGYLKTRLTEEESKEIRVMIRSTFWNLPSMGSLTWAGLSITGKIY